MTQLNEDLRAIQKLLEPEGAWTQHRFSGYRSPRTGRVTFVSGKKVANCWCISGAVEHLAESFSQLERTTRVYGIYEIFYNILRSHFRSPDSGMMAWNDDKRRTKADIDTLLKLAVEATT